MNMFMKYYYIVTMEQSADENWTTNTYRIKTRKFNLGEIKHYIQKESNCEKMVIVNWEKINKSDYCCML